ncbi:MAG TPA: hypothetical protein VK078_05230 [Pseudogracilibacillus sp.]|nr:hypothetical protein [Pseudogracilibacillus sp.]
MKATVSLMVAYLIESPLARGMERQTLLEYVQQEKTAELNDFVRRFEYKDLIEAYKENPENIASAIQFGYQVKFVTLGGVKNLLGMKFALEEEKDFKATENSVLNIPLTQDQFAIVKEMLSSNWELQTTIASDDGFFVNILPKTYTEKRG